MEDTFLSTFSDLMQFSHLYTFNVFYLTIDTSAIKKFRRKMYFCTSLDLSELQTMCFIKANLATFWINLTLFPIN